MNVLSNFWVEKYGGFPQVTTSRSTYGSNICMYTVHRTQDESLATADAGYLMKDRARAFTSLFTIGKPYRKLRF